MYDSFIIELDLVASRFFINKKTKFKNHIFSGVNCFIFCNNIRNVIINKTKIIIINIFPISRSERMCSRISRICNVFNVSESVLKTDEKFVFPEPFAPYMQIKFLGILFLVHRSTVKSTRDL